MKRLAVTFVCLFVCATACKEAPEPGNPRALEATPQQTGIHEVGAAFAEATCAQHLRCCGTTKDAAACKQTLLPRFEQYAAHVATSHLRGRVAYDGEKLKHCLAQIANEPCSDARMRASTGPEAGSDCDKWLSPRVGLGGMCSDDNECMSGYCQGRAPAAHKAMTDGVCAPLPGLGQSCTDTCTRGTYCDTTTDSPHCVRAMPLGTSCRLDDECLSGLCETASGETFGTCQSAPTTCVDTL